MAKTAMKQHEKKTFVKICTTCKDKIIPMSIILNIKKKMAKSCGCGVFIGNEKIA